MQGLLLLSMLACPMLLFPFANMLVGKHLNLHEGSPSTQTLKASPIM